MPRRALSLLLLSIAGCASAHATEAQLRTAASQEFSCPSDLLRVRELNESKRWVAGCGKSATYDEKCSFENDKRKCRWVKGEDAPPAD